VMMFLAYFSFESFSLNLPAHAGATDKTEPTR
jgi:hypothetical protein